MSVLGVQKTLELGKAIGEALGINGNPWNKIVLEIEVGKIAKVYVRGFVRSEGGSGIVQAVKDVMVQDDCTVIVEPHE